MGFLLVLCYVGLAVVLGPILLAAAFAIFVIAATFFARHLLGIAIDLSAWECVVYLDEFDDDPDGGEAVAWRKPTPRPTTGADVPTVRILPLTRAS